MLLFQMQLVQGRRRLLACGYGKGLLPSSGSSGAWFNNSGSALSIAWQLVGSLKEALTSDEEIPLTSGDGLVATPSQVWCVMMHLELHLTFVLLQCLAGYTYCEQNNVCIF